MKKIVSTTLIVGTQLLVGGLFLVTLFTGEKVDNKVVIVENNNLSKMVDIISGLYMNNTEEIIVITEEVEVKENEEIVKNKKEEIIEIVEEVKEEIVEEQLEIKAPEVEYEVLETYTGVLTGYGPDCTGCSGITTSGYNVLDTITYTDSEFGEIRIVAADRQFELYSIVRISGVADMEPIIAIVLDRGSNVGFGRGTLFDLLYPSESVSLQKTENVTFEILRKGLGD